MLQAAREEKTKSSQSAHQTVRAFQKEIQRRFRGNYLLHLPAGYYDSKRKWPTVSSCMVSGERGHDPE
jgi:hypothetical protein